MYVKALERFISALKRPDRVCRIAFRGSLECSSQISEALDLPFPALESLELYKMDNKSVLRATFFMASIRSLRHLRLDAWWLTTLLPILSVTRSLVDLTLNLTIDNQPLNRPSLLAHLENMPRLRNLQVFMEFFTEEMPPSTTVLLGELTCLRFRGHPTQVGWFVAGLVLPSLRELHISFTIFVITPTLHIPYLSKLIHATGIFFSRPD